MPRLFSISHGEKSLKIGSEIEFRKRTTVGSMDCSYRENSHRKCGSSLSHASFPYFCIAPQTTTGIFSFASKESARFGIGKLLVQAKVLWLATRTFPTIAARETSFVLIKLDAWDSAGPISYGQVILSEKVREESREGRKPWGEGRVVKEEAGNGMEKGVKEKTCWRERKWRHKNDEFWRHKERDWRIREMWSLVR